MTLHLHLLCFLFIGGCFLVSLCAVVWSGAVGFMALAGGRLTEDCNVLLDVFSLLPLHARGMLCLEHLHDP